MMRRTRGALLWAAWIVLFVGCSDTAAESPTRPSHRSNSTPEPWSDAWLISEGHRYLNDRGYRRVAMVAALRNPENLYSRTRLASYGLGDRGWDRLPRWNPVSRPFDGQDRRRLEAGQSIHLGNADRFPSARPQSPREWISLGREVFFRYPLRADAFVRFGLSRPDVAGNVGLMETTGGEIPGVVVFRDVDGTTQIGITCALCHTSVENGRTVEGRARRTFDYGRLQVMRAEAAGRSLDPELAARMRSWGPGRADITEDDSEDPVAIPDLWGLRHQDALTQAGTIRHASPAALALRQETQYLYANHHRTRPPRTLVWALTTYLYSITPPHRRVDHRDVTRGAGLFAEYCADCHSNAAYGGRPVSAARVGTDPRLSRGVARGTGLYRPSALVRVAEGGPYLHHGAVASLADMFSSKRFSDDYSGPLGTGAVPGHRWGTELTEGEKRTLVDFLETL